MSETENEVEKARELLSEILTRMGFEATVAAKEEDEKIVLDISCGEVERIIGRRGQTIDAMQHLVGKMLTKGREGRGRPVLVDADGYRDRHIAKLEELAKRMGEKAIQSGDEVELSPMNPFDRRIIHVTLKDVEGVSTRSEGEGSDRRVIVIPD